MQRYGSPKQQQKQNKHKHRKETGRIHMAMIFQHNKHYQFPKTVG